MHTPEEIRLSAIRDDIYEQVVARFRVLIAEDRHDDAIALADEFYEWLDPNQMEDEETHYCDEEEIKEIYNERF
tara:strand:- start:254 stop:475 length:222 start_codon:yes stop_codon:yes gene_type:complete